MRGTGPFLKKYILESTWRTAPSHLGYIFMATIYHRANKGQAAWTKTKGNG